MGAIIGGLIGGIGSLIGGGEAASAQKQGAQDALTGYHYLASNPLIAAAQANATSNIPNQNAALGSEGSTVGAENQLLTSNGVNNPAYQNYLNSTGYNFQMQQGSDAITGNAASKGLLDSGATAKALTTYGQNLAATTFNNYLGQLGNVANQQGALASGYGNTVNQGLAAADAVGQAGTTGGGNAGNLLGQAGQSLGTSTANAFNLVGGGVQSAINGTGGSNFFSSPAAPQFAGIQI